MKSKRTKINFELINKYKNSTPIDMSKAYEDAKKRMEEDQARYKRELEDEKLRINNLKCPCCKSKDKRHYCRRDGNSIIGPGSRSWVVEEYLICSKCGIHYSDLNKKEIQSPSKGLFGISF